MAKLIELINNGTFQKSSYLSKEDYFLHTFENLCKLGKVDKGFYESIVEREKLYPTGLKLNGRAVAIPHTEHMYVKDESIIIDIFENPIEFNNMENFEDTVNVDISFMLLLSKAHSHVEILRQLIELFNSEKLMDQLYECNNKEEAIAIIKSVVK